MQARTTRRRKLALWRLCRRIIGIRFVSDATQAYPKSLSQNCALASNGSLSLSSHKTSPLPMSFEPKHASFPHFEATFQSPTPRHPRRHSRAPAAPFIRSGSVQGQRARRRVAWRGYSGRLDVYWLQCPGLYSTFAVIRRL